MNFNWAEIEGTQLEKRLQDYPYEDPRYQDERREQMEEEAQEIIDKAYGEWYDVYDCENDELYDLITDMEAELDMIHQGLIDIYDFKQDFSEYLEG